MEAASPPLPEGITGIAAKYPGDVGMERDAAVIFVENFEQTSLADMKARWEEVKSIECMSFSTQIPSGAAGRHSLLVKHIGGKGTGGHLYRRLLPGYDRLFLRFYVKFDPQCYPVHHFVHMGGYNPPTRWPQGGAGIRPAGDERFTTGVEPCGSRWRWDFYSYWMEMRAAPSGDSWGNHFISDDNLKAVRGKWIFVELMMKMNSPVGERNGEEAIWIDGQLWRKDGQITSHVGKGFPRGKWVWGAFTPDAKGDAFEGFRWRKDEKLNLNFLWMLVYITQAPEGHESRIWFDNIVVAREYIGPLKPIGMPGGNR